MIQRLSSTIFVFEKLSYPDNNNFNKRFSQKSINFKVLIYTIIYTSDTILKSMQYIAVFAISF